MNDLIESDIAAFKEKYADNTDVNIHSLLKETDHRAECYVFIHNDENRAEALRTLGRFASDLELSFIWYDASILSQKIMKDMWEEERERINNWLKNYFD